MEVRNQYNYVLTDRFGVLEVAPLGEGDFSISHEQDDDGKYFYSKVFNGKIMFTGATYARLKKIEKSIYLCSQQRLQVYRMCGDTEILIFDGYFKLSEGDWNDEFCTVVLKFQKSTPDKCLSDNKTTKINILQMITPAITVRTGTAGGVVEYKNCSKNSNTQGEAYYWCGTGEPEDGNWVVYSWSQNSPDGMHHFTRTNWAREVVTVACGETVPPEWILIESCVGGQEKYAKKVTLYDCIVQDGQSDPDTGSYSFGMTCKIVGYTAGNTVIDNGRLLNSTIEFFVKQFCPDLTVISDFFQINPENPSIINYVTGEVTQVDKLVLFQKSDVKRPQATGNATKAEWTFEKLMETLTFMFNVSYSVENGVFRLEHISWFTRSQGIDLTQQKYDKYTKGMRKYTYDVDSIPKRENWKFKEQLNGGLYTGIIDYSISCVSSGKDEEKIYLVDELMTDVQYAMNNPSSDSNLVEDAGFVMVATKLVAGNYYIIQDKALNDALAWINLIPNYHYYNRPVNEGVYNGDEVTFYSTKPIKKGRKVVIPIECGQAFDPTNTILTPLGEGIVDKADFNLRTCMMELELKYNAFDNLTDNEPPLIQNGNFSVYANQFKIYDIVATDSDGVVESVAVTFPPTNGTVEVLSIAQIKYTPNAGFDGFDVFGLTAYDDWNQASQQANFGVTVLPANQPPIAMDDEYTVYHEQAFISSPSIFANDSDDHGFTLVTPNVTTAQGVAISIDSVTGIFSYTPPTGFVGDDTFNYTIEDNNGSQSTATVTLHVSFNSHPVAVNDSYQTLQNSPLQTDGTNVKPTLLQNDYVPDGFSYPLTATVETKTTALGGNVNISADGTIYYTPPAGVVSQIDNFNYTVNNANGSDTGNVQIAILPNIYVKIVRSDLKTVGHPSQPTYYRTADYTLYFYSNSAGTVPLDVTGLGLMVNIKEHNVISGSGGSSSYDYIWRTEILTGTSKKIYDDYTYYDYTSWDGGYNSLNKTITIQTGTYGIIV